MGDRPVERNRRDEPTVEEVLAVDLDRRKHARHGRRGQDCLDQQSGREVVGRSVLDACCDAFKLDRKVVDAAHGQDPFEELPQHTVVAQVGSRPGEGGDLGKDRAPKHPRAVERGPQPGQRLDAPSGRVGTDHRPVDRPDRGAHDQVRGDADFDQRSEHPHLVGTEVAAAAQDECGSGFHSHFLHRASPRHTVSRPPDLRRR